MTNVAEAVRLTAFAGRLAAFMARREKCIGSAFGAAEVAKYFEKFAQNAGQERACELLDLAARFDDYGRRPL